MGVKSKTLSSVLDGEFESIPLNDDLTQSVYMGEEGTRLVFLSQYRPFQNFSHRDDMI